LLKKSPNDVKQKQREFPPMARIVREFHLTSFKAYRIRKKIPGCSGDFFDKVRKDI